MYQGRYSIQQTTGNSYKGRNYSNNEADFLNNYQNLLYRRALLGINVYPQEEIEKMHYDKRKRIEKVHRKTQDILNLWKQEIVVGLSNMFFQIIFPKTEITKQLLEDKQPTDPNFINKMSFKDLHITKSQIIDKLIKERILPANFKNLKPIEFAS